MSVVEPAEPDPPVPMPPGSVLPPPSARGIRGNTLKRSQRHPLYIIDSVHDTHTPYGRSTQYPAHEKMATIDHMAKLLMFPFPSPSGYQIERTCGAEKESQLL